MRLGRFYNPNQHGKSTGQLNKEIREVNAEIRKRTNNGLDCDDQRHRLAHLREARVRQN